MCRNPINGHHKTPGDMNDFGGDFWQFQAISIHFNQLEVRSP